MSSPQPIPCGLDAPIHPDGRPAECSPQWLTEVVVGLARGIRADQAFDRLPVLADALEEAGCDDAVILNHCRGCDRHVMGCWAVEAVLEFEDRQPVIVPLPPKPTVLGRLLDGLKEEILVRPGVVKLRPQLIPQRERWLARIGCVLALVVGTVVVITVTLLISAWWYRRV
jgi:hypothetical protein